MIRDFSDGTEWTELNAVETGGLGSLALYHPEGTFGLTPASRILIEAIAKNRDTLTGTGIDWGSGVGTQAILAARIGAVDMVYGLEISEENVRTATLNAERNGVASKTRFFLSDGYAPFSPADRQALDVLKGHVDFIVSNPPSSDWDDGFGFRRLVMSGAGAFLKPGGRILLNISYQYGPDRVVELARMDGFQYEGVAATTDWVPFDLNRAELLDCLKIYATVEERGEPAYAFKESSGGRLMDARGALGSYRCSGVSPLSKWQTHSFRFIG